MVALEIFQTILSSCWSFFTEVQIPGLGIPFSALFLGVILAEISVSIFRSLTGQGEDYRSGSSHNPKISDERKGDQF